MLPRAARITRPGAGPSHWCPTGTIRGVMKRAFSSCAIPTLALACLIFAATGCGGSDESRVVTRTVTEAAVVESSPAPQASAADEAWAALVRRQNEQLTEVARRAQGASNSYEFWQVSNEVISRAGYEVSTTSTAGLSACMADVPSKWEAVLTGFTTGGAAGAGQNTLSLRDQTLATVEDCVAESSASAGEAGDDLAPVTDLGASGDGCGLIAGGIGVVAKGLPCSEAISIASRARSRVTMPDWNCRWVPPGGSGNFGRCSGRGTLQGQVVDWYVAD